VIELLRNRADHLDIDRFGQAGEFFQRIGDAPVGVAGFDAHEERALLRLIGNEHFVRNRDHPSRSVRGIISIIIDDSGRDEG